MNPIIQYLWVFVCFFMNQLNYIKFEYRKRWGDYKWVNLTSKEPQILHIYYYRNTQVIEPWGCDVYRRWNARLHAKKILRGSEWFHRRFACEYDGIIVEYRFREQEWVEQINWGRNSICRVDERLELLRSWSFPRWNAESWNQERTQKIPKFPISILLNGEEQNVEKWKKWLGPEGRREQSMNQTNVMRPWMNFYDIQNEWYWMEETDKLVIDWGMKEEIIEIKKNN